MPLTKIWSSSFGGKETVFCSGFYSLAVWHNNLDAIHSLLILFVDLCRTVCVFLVRVMCTVCILVLSLNVYCSNYTSIQQHKIHVLSWLRNISSISTLFVKHCIDHPNFNFILIFCCFSSAGLSNSSVLDL